NRDLAFEHLGRARSLAEDGPPTRAKAFVISSSARLLMLAGENQEALRFGAEALRIAGQLGIDQLRAHALNTIGVAKVHGGDLTGIEDLEQSVELAREAHAAEETCRAQGNLAALLWEQGSLERAHSL